MASARGRILDDLPTDNDQSTNKQVKKTLRADAARPKEMGAWNKPRPLPHATAQGPSYTVRMCRTATFTQADPSQGRGAARARAREKRRTTYSARMFEHRREPRPLPVGKRGRADASPAQRIDRAPTASALTPVGASAPRTEGRKVLENQANRAREQRRPVAEPNAKQRIVPHHGRAPTADEKARGGFQRGAHIAPPRDCSQCNQLGFPWRKSPHASQREGYDATRTTPLAGRSGHLLPAEQRVQSGRSQVVAQKGRNMIQRCHATERAARTKPWGSAGARWTKALLTSRRIDTALMVPGTNDDEDEQTKSGGPPRAPDGELQTLQPQLVGAQGEASARNTPLPTGAQPPRWVKSVADDGHGGATP